MADYDLIGSIAVIKSEKDGKKKTARQKKKEAGKLLSLPCIKTVLEKISNVKGRLRKIETKHIAGVKTTKTIHKENGCSFFLDVNTCYFSPRLANDRKEVAKKIKKTDSVLVMFAGVGAYPIVIEKIAKPRKITAIELNKECTKYFKENISINKIPSEKIAIIQGDVVKKISTLKGKFEVIMMARPNLKETFLKEALKVSKKGTRIWYHAFCHQDELKNIVQSLLQEAKKLKKKIQIKEIKKAGDIAPYKFRYRIDMRVQ